METVEMDLMQAQIGSLATDVSRLEAKVAKGGGGGSDVEVVTISDLTFNSQTSIDGLASKSAIEINNMINEGKVVFLKADIPQQGVYIAPVQSSSSEMATADIIAGLSLSGYSITAMQVMHISISPTNFAHIIIGTGTF